MSLHDASEFGRFLRRASPLLQSEGNTMTAPAGETQEPTPAAPKPGPQGGQSDPEKTFTQAQVNAIMAQTRRDTEAKFDGFEDIKAKATQLDQLTESTKSEVQRANESAAEFKSRSEASEAKIAVLTNQLLRQQVAADKKLPASMWKRVSGTTREEIEADVEDLLSSVSSPTEKKPIGALRSGASTATNTDPKERAAAALRNQWQNR